MSELDAAAAQAGVGTAASDSFDASHRSRHRYTRAAMTAAAGFGSKAVSAIAVYVMVRLLYQSLGDVRFGIWSTCHTMLAMTAFADFGIGNGMLNAVTTANARRDQHDLSSIVSSGTYMLAIVATAIGVIFFFSWPVLSQLIVTPDLDRDEIAAVTAGFVAFLVYALLSMPLGTGDRIATALQEGFVIHLARAISQVVAVAAVYIATHMALPFWAICASSIVPGLLASVGTWACILHNRPWLMPRPGAFDLAWAKRLFQSGCGFFAVQMAALLGFNLDTLIVAKGSSAAAAADFALVNRLFSIALVLGTIVLAPLWPAYADAMASGDYKWAKHALSRSLGFALGVGLAVCGGIYALRQPLVSLWLGRDTALPDDLIAVTAIWTVILLAGTALAMFWNGMHWLRLQWILGLSFALAALPLKIWAAQAHWPVGVVAANMACFGCLSLVPGLLWTYRKLHALAHGPPIVAERQ